MKRAYIFSNKGDGILRAEVEQYLALFGIQTVSTPKTAQLSIVLGGDGSALGAARNLPKYPMLVINTGHLGFLTSADMTNWKPAIDAFLSGNFTTTRRTMLNLIVSDDSPPKRFSALNDIVIAKDGLSKLIKVALYIVNGRKEQLVSEYRADGLIISSPTGSTAYNLSAGGPIIHPDVNAFVVTPICPQGLTQRPLVLPDDVKIRIKTLDDVLYLSVDGQVGQVFHRKDIATIEVRHQVDIVNPVCTYFEILRQKLSWGVKPV